MTPFARGGVLIATTALVLFGASAALGAVGNSEPVACGSIERERTEFQYASFDGVDPDLTSLDVHATPGAEGCPILVWVHGGSWQAGGKRTRATTVKADHYTQQGWTFVSVNYRLAAEDNDVRWPDFGNDVADAVAWTIGNAESFGGDPDRVSIIGHSSGAHLVSIVGTHPTLLEEQGSSLGAVNCVVSLDSVTQDLTDPPPWEVDIIELAFPSDEQQIDGSPTLQAIAADQDFAGPDFLIVTRGRDERIDSSERLAASINGSGGTAAVADVSPYDHGQVSTELGVPGETLVTDPVDGFLNTCAAPAL